MTPDGSLGNNDGQTRMQILCACYTSHNLAIAILRIRAKIVIVVKSI